MSTEKVLLKFFHGLGDAVQLTIVLQHLQKYRPQWELHLKALRGKHSVGNGYCRQIMHDGEPAPDEGQFQRVFDLAWWECYSAYSDSPSTKACNCLREVFGIQPDPALLKYKLHVGPEAVRITQAYLSGIGAKKLPSGRYNAVAIHYEGNTSAEKKNLRHEEVALLCETLIEAGFVPVILDWDRRSPIPDQRRIFNPGAGEGDIWGNFGSGDAERITALIGQCSLFVGIDSGPQKCAGATDTPSIGVWTKHHPVQFMDLCDNFTHLVPLDWQNVPPCNNAVAATYFTEHYQYRTYRPASLRTALCEEACKKLGLNPMMRARLLRATGYTEDYYREHRAAGLDYLNYGDWQRDYGRWLIESLGMRGKTALDIGCACGSLAAGLAEAGAYVSGIDLSQHMIELGRAKWPGFPLFVCDSVNLHLWRDGTFDLLHSNQTFEHLRPELVPFILKELRRVTKDGGLLFCVLDTAEQFARQGRSVEDGREKDGDPTHVCIKPMAWWHDELVKAGWQLEPSLLNTVREASGSYFKLYDWDAFLCRKVTA